MNVSERLKYFGNAVRKDIENKKRIAENEMNEKKRTAIKKLDEKLKEEIKNYYSEKSEKIKTAALKNISDNETENRKRLISLRNELRRDVYNEIFEKLKSIKGGEEYYEAMKIRLDKALSKISDPSSSVIHISKNDAEKLKLDGLNISYEEYELGGFEIEADNGKGYIDCRIATSLEEHINDFVNLLGVVI